MAKLKLKHLNPLDRSLERLEDTLLDHGARLSRLGADVAAKRSLPADLERIATLLDGVRVALERMGGNTLPSFREDVSALRNQMGEFRQELAGYRSALMRLSNWLDRRDAVHQYGPESKPSVQPKAWSKDYSGPLQKDRPKRSYNRRKKSDPSHLQVEKLAQDVAPHNNSDEEPDVTP